MNMAFGKDHENLQSVKPFGAGTSFSQRNSFLMRNQGEQRQRRSGGGMRFSDIYKPTESPSGFDLVRLLPGSYPYRSCDGKKNVYEYALEYWPFIEHFDGRNQKSAICSGGVFHNFKNDRDPCIGCDLFFSTMDKQKGPDGRRKSRVSKQDKYAFNVLHYNPYHKIAQVDDSTGRVRTNEQSGEAYYEWVPCEGRGCPICPQNVETVGARVLKWEMSFSHYKAMTTAYSDAIALGCKTCKSKKSIQSLAWICSTPSGGCGEAVIDLSDTTLKDEDILKIISEPVTCPHCKHIGFLDEVFQCSGCGQPERCTIFDVNMNVKRVKSGQGDSKQTALIVSDWTEACDIDPRFTEIVKVFDMPKIYGPSTIEFQQRQFQIEAPAQGQAVQPQAGGLTRTPVTANSGFKNYTGAPQGTPPAGTMGGQGPNFSR
jgi:hypothetical protein